jgi:hypothetical protein
MSEHDAAAHWGTSASRALGPLDVVPLRAVDDESTVASSEVEGAQPAFAWFRNPSPTILANGDLPPAYPSASLLVASRCQTSCCDHKSFPSGALDEACGIWPILSSARSHGPRAGRLRALCHIWLLPIEWVQQRLRKVGAARQS